MSPTVEHRNVELGLLVTLGREKKAGRYFSIPREKTRQDTINGRISGRTTRRRHRCKLC